MKSEAIAYIFIMAVVTYLIRMIPFVLFRRKIKSRFVKSFLYYVPYAVLSAMTIPSIFYSTGSTVTATVGFAASVAAGILKRSLAEVALVACVAVYLSGLIIQLVK